MKLFTLRSVIDDVLLMIRNNNVSESEDFSRAQIALWILAYKAAILKKKQEKDKKNATEKDYQRFLKYLSKKNIKACKKGNFDYCFDATCERKILDRLKTDLNNNGYKVNISGPFYGLDVYWAIRVSLEE